MSPRSKMVESFAAGFPRVSGDEPAGTGDAYPGNIRFPRVSGDEPAVGCELDERYMFSPRERG